MPKIFRLYPCNMCPFSLKSKDDKEDAMCPWCRRGTLGAPKKES